MMVSVITMIVQFIWKPQFRLSGTLYVFNHCQLVSVVTYITYIARTIFSYQLLQIRNIRP